MKFNEWLDQEGLRAQRLAEHFGITPSAVSQWKTNGVPISRMKAVQAFSKNKVSLKEMLDDAVSKAA